jgi:hypothetical protein
VPVMAVAHLGGRGRGLDRMAVAMVAPAHFRWRGRRGGVVVAMMDTGLRRAAGEGDRGGDDGDGPDANGLAVNGSDHAIS